MSVWISTVRMHPERLKRPNTSSASTPPESAAPAPDDAGGSSRAPHADPPPSIIGSMASVGGAGHFFGGGAAAAGTGGAGGFVFGQKLHERVANMNHAPAAPESPANGSHPGDNLFTVIAKEKSDEDSGTSSSAGGAAGSSSSSNGILAGKTLTDSARELEEARAAKRKYDEVAVVTGEEDEQNALQVYGKLFTFDKVQGTWIERGRGTLRLNDKKLDNGIVQSRLVMRTQGSLRVILNTKVWPDMTVDKASSKSVRLTALDGDQIRVFLLMASLKDTETLFNALEWRLATVKSNQSRANYCSTTTSSLTDRDEASQRSTSPQQRRCDTPEAADEGKKKRCE
nr:EOG090X078K [Leptodora kindtii]